MKRMKKHQQFRKLRHRRVISIALTLSMMMSGFQGLSLPTFAEEGGSGVVEGSEDKLTLNLDGAALQLAAENAVKNGSTVSLGGAVFADSSLRRAYESYFGGEHAVYELELSEIDDSLEGELSDRSAGLRIFIEPHPVGKAIVDDATVALYEENGELAGLISGGDIYNNSEAVSIESDADPAYEINGRARISFLYENDGSSTKTFVLKVDDERIDSVKVRAAAKLMPSITSAVRKNIREELLPEERKNRSEETVAAAVQESQTEAAAEENTETLAGPGEGLETGAEAEAPAGPGEELSAEENGVVETAAEAPVSETEAETEENIETEAEAVESLDSENSEAPEHTEELTEESAEAEAQQEPEADTVSEETAEAASDEENSGLMTGLVAASRRPIESLGVLIQRGIRSMLRLGVLEANAAENEAAEAPAENAGNAENNEETHPVEETAAEAIIAETEAAYEDRAPEIAASGEAETAEASAENTEADTLPSYETETEAPAELTEEESETVAKLASASELETEPTLAPAPDMADRESELELLKGTDARELIDAVVLKQYRASELFRNVETERRVKLTYRAQLGGRVSLTEESVDILSDDIAVQGSTAEANEKYYIFDGWENAAGEIVCSDAFFAPEIESIKADTVFTARFVRRVEMPAFKRTWAGDRLIVTIEAPENTFPEGTELAVSEVSEEQARSVMQEAVGGEQDVSRAVAVDIRFLFEGEEIQPENQNNVRVSMTLSGDRRMDEAVVVHKHEGERAETIEAEESSRNSRTQTIRFDAERFSIYGIGELAPVLVYTFHGAEGEKLEAVYTDEGEEKKLTEQRVKKGDKVYAPSSPEKENAVFIGWSRDKDKAVLSPEMEAFDTDRAPFDTFTIEREVEKGKEESYYNISYYPVFTERLYVFFKESANDAARVIATRQGAGGDEILLMRDNASEIPVALPLTQAVVGWAESIENANAEPYTALGDKLTLTDKNMTLYPIIREGHYIYFNTGAGASYLPPDFVSVGRNITEPEQPVRAGYEFAGWTTDETPDAIPETEMSGKKFTGFGSGWQSSYGGEGAVLRLYAMWKKSNAEYSVIIWKQKVTDSKEASDSEKKYEYGSTLKLSALTGNNVSTASVTEAQILASGNYKGFHRNTKTESASLRGDGKTVLNLYMDRNLLTIRFSYKIKDTYRFEAVRRWSWGNYAYYRKDNNVRVYPEGYYIEQIGYSNSYRFYNKVEYYTGLYGSLFTDGGNSYTWPGTVEWIFTDEGGAIQPQYLTFLHTFNFDELDYNYDNATKIYLVQSDAGSSKIVHYLQDAEGNGYSTHYTASSRGGNYLPNNKFGTGYYLSEYREDSYSDSTWKSIVQNDDGSYNPASLSIGKGLSFRYNRKSFILEYKDGVNSLKKTVRYGASLSGYNKMPEELEGQPIKAPKGYEFDCWVEKTADGNVFDFSAAMPADNVLLIPRWKPINYTVTLHTIPLGDEEEISLVLGTEYHYGDVLNKKAMPKVLSGTEVIFGDDSDSEKTIEVPENSSWGGWQIKDGDEYKPYAFGAEITGNLDLYAKYLNINAYSVSYKLLGNAESLGELDNADAFKHQGESGDGIYTDSQGYASGSSVELKGADIITVMPIIKLKDGETVTGTKTLTFLGWKLETLERSALSELQVLQPGDVINLTGNTRLEAVYGTTEDLTELCYMANYPDGGEALKADGALPKSEHSIKSLSNNISLKALGFNEGTGFPEIPDDYEYIFKGWSTEKQTEPSEYTEGDIEGVLKPGAEFRIDKAANGEKNVLYGYWCIKPRVSLTIRNTVSGNLSNKTDEFKYTMTVKKNGAALTIQQLGIEGVTYEDGKLSWIMNGESDAATLGRIFAKLPRGAELSLSVEDSSGRHYITTASVETGADAIDFTQLGEGGGTVPEFTITGDTVLVFTHSLDYVAPTGVVRDNLPFILMLLGAVALGAYFVLGRRKRYDEED